MILKDFSTPILYQVCFGIMGAFGDFLLDGDVVDEGFGIFCFTFLDRTKDFDSMEILGRYISKMMLDLI